MSFFQWDTSLDVGVEEMNHQHQILIDLMNVLYEKNLAGATQPELLKSVHDLLNYVVKHFQEEESYMASIHFPLLEVHQKLHKNLLTTLRNFAEELTNTPTAKIDDKFMIFLNLWISTHIRGIDTKYGILLR